MKKFLFFLCSCLLFLPLILSGTQKETEKRYTRIHQIIPIQETDALEYTWIHNYTKVDERVLDSEMIVLIDLKESGKWVFIHNVKDDNTSKEKREETFKCVETQESLTITYADRGSNKEEFIITAKPSNKEIKLSINDLPQNPSNFIPFVKENFSDKFVQNLDKLRKIVFLIYTKNISFELTPYSFRPIWGITKETEKMGFLNPEKVNQPLTLHYNCDFDKEFGYPCSPDEVPAKNPKVLVKEKK